MLNSLFHTVFGFLWLGFSLLVVVFVSLFAAVASGVVHVVNIFDRVVVGR